MPNSLTVAWIDRGVEPQGPPDPTYPNGMGADFTGGAGPGCSTLLPYPAKRCGYFLVSCRACKSNAILTTAGRADDPRWVRIACKITGRSRRRVEGA